MPGNGRGHDKHLLQLVTLPSPRPPFTPCATDFSAMVSHAFGSRYQGYAVPAPMMKLRVAQSSNSPVQDGLFSRFLEERVRYPAIYTKKIMLIYIEFGTPYGKSRKTGIFPLIFIRYARF